MNGLFVNFENLLLTLPDIKRCRVTSHALASK